MGENVLPTNIISYLNKFYHKKNIILTLYLVTLLSNNKDCCDNNCSTPTNEQNI